MARARIACLIVLAACGGDDAQQCVVHSITVTADVSAVVQGQSLTLSSVIDSTGLCTGAVTWSASPDGGTVTPGGSTASFAAATPGTYAITAADGDNPSITGSATVTVGPPCATPNGMTVTHTSNITADETWAGGGVTHIIPSQIQIMAPATLTIEACAIVTFGAGQGIEVAGDAATAMPAKLVAAGTDDMFGFIVFQAIDASQPWGFLQGDNEQSSIELDHVQLIGAGTGGTATRNSAIAMNGAGYDVAPAPVLTVKNVVLDHPLGGGVFLDTNAEFTPASTGLTVIGAPDYSIALDMMALGSLPVVTSQGDAHDDVLVIGPSQNVFADLTITNRMPVRINTVGDLIVAPPASSSLTGVMLTVEPGAIVRFSGTNVVFGTTGHGAANTNGVLLAVGTPQQPIQFTSGAATPAPGDWGGLQLLTSVGSELENAAVEYAGGASGIVSTNCRPVGQPDNAAVIVGSDTFTPAVGLIKTTQIVHSAGFGIDAVWAAATDNAPDLTIDNTFDDNAGCSQTFNGLTVGMCPAGGGCL